MSWQPIETAPSGHTDCLLYFSPIGHIEDAVIWWDEDGGFRYMLFDAENLTQTPTHWMPLPEPPK